MVIPYELIIDILSRLPSKSLLRFQCVCKLWRSLIIHDPDFRNLHLHNANNSNNNNDLAHWLCIHSKGWIRLHSYQVLDKTFSSGKLEPFPEFNCPHKHERGGLVEEVVGSCKGLICVYYRMHYSIEWTKYTFGLWNPSTRTHKTLELSTPESWHRVSYDKLIGVGFSKKDSDHKVVVLAKNRSNNLDYHVYLYTLHDNSWSDLKVDETDSSWLDWRTHHFGGTYFNGAFHWTCSIQGKYVILCFDFDDKSIRLIDLPPRHWGDTLLTKTLVHKDMLAHWDGGLEGHSEDRFWVMKEYGNLNSWTCLFQVEKEKLPSSCFIDIFGTTIDGKLLLYRSSNNNMESYILKAYDTETKESKDLQVTNVFTLISHQESLMLW